jgi:predicted nucleotidyltransferase
LNEHLAQRVRDRDALLRRAAEVLVADGRVAAAWLLGSLGRGDEDDWSDLDLWVVVRDDAIREVADGRREYVRVLGEPILLVEAPPNAPPGGAYLMAFYGAEGGSQQVDWYWQPQSGAAVPADVRVLFDRVGLPHAAPPAELIPEVRARALSLIVPDFWAMLPIAAKKITRVQPWVVLRMLDGMRARLEEAKWYAGVRATPPTYRDEFTVPPPFAPEEQLNLLRELASEMRALDDAIWAAGAFVPTEAAEEAVRFVGLVKRVIAAQHG